MKQIAYTDRSLADFARIPVRERARLLAKLRRYAETGAGDVVRMTGVETSRLRMGDYRAVFRDTDTAITVVAVGHRRDIYR